MGDVSDENGRYSIQGKEGEYVVMATSIGYEPAEESVRLQKDATVVVDLTLQDADVEIEEVVVESVAGVATLRKSAFNAVALDATELYNTSKNLSDALAKAPGIKLRESGGVGSDMNVMLDGFSGKHVKVFIDGVPQEGNGSSFGIGNLPVNMAERIEVYKGVVPVNFGTDAIGGVINIVSKKQQKGWHTDVSYTYGSFNTHKAYADYGITTEKGLTGMIKVIFNYSDNDYKIQTPVEDFATGSIDTKINKTVRRFNDTYHNEAIQAKVGLNRKRWADRIAVGATLSKMYKEIQTGVRQIIVYGAKYRKGRSVEPTLEYAKRGIAGQRLDIQADGRLNISSTTNVDTSDWKFNWYGERKKLNSPGEQSYQNNEAKSKTLSVRGAIVYHITNKQSLTLNHALNTFRRSNTNHITGTAQNDAIEKVTRKNISGLSYQVFPNEMWNASAFAKYYRIDVSGPIATDANQSTFVKTSHAIDHWGGGAATTAKSKVGVQIKASYELACRLPTIDEMFGDDDLENGDISIKPEKSHNVNVSVSYGHSFGQHEVYAEVGCVYRNTDDYIQRNIIGLSGGKTAASYVNYGNVLTKGFNASVRYQLDRRLSVGGNFTHMNVIDNQKTIMGSSGENVSYGERMPNVPYMFADAEASYRWHDVISKGNTLSVMYDNQYLHEFCYNAANVGTKNKRDYMVPNQFSHNIMLSYTIRDGRYNISFEGKNITNEKLYDNFSLQKAGRAFYGKVRLSVGNETHRENHRKHNRKQHTNKI